MDIWTYPKTFKVGDTLNADTLNDRIRDHNNLLLRRPLTAVTMSATQSIPTNSNLTLVWDTIVQDDDGMVLGDVTPATQFYAQRIGSYRFWCSIGITTIATAQTVALTALVGGVVVGQNSLRMEARTGLPFMINVTGLVSMSPGEPLKVYAYNGLTTQALTVQNSNNTPTLAIMWMGPS